MVSTEHNETTVDAHYLDVIRYYQASQMFEKHLMMPIRVLRDELSPSYDRQLLAT